MMEHASNEPGLSLWTVYDHPSDYPDAWVARRWMIRANQTLPTGDVVVGKTLALVRDLLPPGLYRLERLPHDDKTIVEVWL